MPSPASGRGSSCTATQPVVPSLPPPRPPQPCSRAVSLRLPHGAGSAHGRRPPAAAGCHQADEPGGGGLPAVRGAGVREIGDRSRSRRRGRRPARDRGLQRDDLFADYHVGGIVYFAWAHNTPYPRQITDPPNGIQRARLRHGTPIPLLISIDQEQGDRRADRCTGDALCRRDGAGRGRQHPGRRTASRVVGTGRAAKGANQNYSPVCGVNVISADPVIGVRSFGAGPEAVAALAAAQVVGCRMSPSGWFWTR
ncbi:glycoside hydrolase family 3 N-terminal domain-containing protein [Actinacidiphila sp. ITFR-21]|uniref:glycoside hydrolase family 3 N-terminal domain-containing protein n=1 Tax=Actinacidiphila sp. ITFR-21 TaxID=3075199 RepID=UPI0037D9C7DE